MPTPIEAISAPCNKQQFVKAELLLENHAVIQNCMGMPSNGSWYTDDIQILFVKRGAFQLSYGGHTFVLGEQQIVLLKQNIWVDYQRGYLLPSEQVEYIRFNIRHSLIKEFMRLIDLPIASSQPPSPVLVTPGESSFQLYIESLGPALSNNKQAEDGFVKVKMLELLFHLSNMDKVIFSRFFTAREHYRTDITSTIEENITSAMSVNQLARLSGRSLSSFRRDFVAIYNMPPKRWIRRKRIEKAKQLLLSTSMTITDICYTLGFENIAHFSRLFKSCCGLPPSCYKSHNNAALEAPPF